MAINLGYICVATTAAILITAAGFLACGIFEDRPKIELRNLDQDPELEALIEIHGKSYMFDFEEDELTLVRYLFE